MDSGQAPTRNLTLRNVRRDFPEWHLGRSHFALWALQVDVAPVRQRMRAAQAHLAPHLLDGYHRQPHITLGLCGFLSPAPLRADDFTPEALRQQLAALRRLQPAGFEIAIGGLASFSSVPYLTVQAASGPIERLRLCLAQSDMDSAPGQYLPHVTVGLYAGVWPMETLQTQFDRFTDTGELVVKISGVSLMSYAPAEIGGPLQTLADYTFETGQLRWHSALPPVLQAFESLA